jgi:putative isomerase
MSDRGSRLVIMQPADSDGLMIRLAERLTDVEPGIEAYLNRPHFIDQLQPVDGEGAPLDFTLTTYPHAIFLETRVGSFGVAFYDLETISIGLPDTEAGVRFHVRPGLMHQSSSSGDFRAVRDLAYATNNMLSQHCVEPSEDGYDVLLVATAGADTAIMLHIAENAQRPDAVPFSEVLAAAENRWHRWFDAAPPVDARYRDQYLYAWWIMANNLVAPKGVITYEAMMPSKSHYVGIWQWDAFFHALAYRHVDAELAADQFRVMFASQQPDGMLPDAIWDEGVVTEIDHPVAGTVTKPPIAAWATLKVYQTTQDRAFLEEMYGPLVRLFNWWMGMNDDDSDGLAQYNHPYSSGLDDSPLWDYGMPVESPELNTYLCLASQAQAEMADVLGKPHDAAGWRTRASSLVQHMIEDLWDEEAGIFWATRNGERIPVVTPFNLYPLLTGMLPQDIAARLVEHLINPEEFWSKYPLPTVSMNDSHYDPLTMWRGPVWININALFVDGLVRAGYSDLAQDLRERTLNLVMSQRGIYEYYHPQTGEPPKKTAFAFGWSAACFIDLAIQASRQPGLPTSPA